MFTLQGGAKLAHDDFQNTECSVGRADETHRMPAYEEPQRCFVAGLFRDTCRRWTSQSLSVPVDADWNDLARSCDPARTRLKNLISSALQKTRMEEDFFSSRGSNIERRACKLTTLWERSP